MAEPVLKKGSNDPEVRDLQEAMKALGHDPGPIDGVFGEATEAAVKAFQQENGITVDGIVGEPTWVNIDLADHSEPILRIGSTGLAVRRLQRLLIQLSGVEDFGDLDIGGIDGRYGTKTEAAVKAFQQAVFDPSRADGVVGADTWNEIDITVSGQAVP
jgi:peptidoglycan hydrolase-like protein with peptidoglycan-binding domain